MNMQRIWTDFEAWLTIHAPTLLETLQCGASNTQIGQIEARLSIQFPEEVKHFYRIHNGQSIDRYGLIDGREFLSLERVQEEWQIWKDLWDQGTFQLDNGADQGSDAEPGIRPVWWSPGWIPLTYDGAGNHDCLDLDPAEGGTVGQIISLWHDDATRQIVAPSFRAWLQTYIKDL